MAKAEIETLFMKVPHLKMRLKKMKLTEDRLCDRLGGYPNRWAEKPEWPLCGCCSQPLFFVVQFLSEKQGGRTRLGKASALQVFVCHGKNCGFYELRSKSHL